jgi:hypothetical protein
VTTLEVFGSIDIRFGFYDWTEDYIVITVHPEWNLIFFAVEEITIIAYDMNHREVHDILALVLGMVDVWLKKSSSADHTIFLMFPCSRIH